MNMIYLKTKRLRKPIKSCINLGVINIFLSVLNRLALRKRTLFLQMKTKCGEEVTRKRKIINDFSDVFAIVGSRIMAYLAKLRQISHYKHKENNK